MAKIFLTCDGVSYCVNNLSKSMDLKTVVFPDDQLPIFTQLPDFQGRTFKVATIEVRWPIISPCNVHPFPQITSTLVKQECLSLEAPTTTCQWHFDLEMNFLTLTFLILTVGR